MAVKCHEFFGCKRKDTCPYYSYEGEKKCWEVDLSLTPFLESSSGVRKSEEKISFCRNCLYYEHMNKDKE